MEDATGIASDIVILRGLIDGPDAGLASYMAERPYLANVQAARQDLARLIAGLDDVRVGRIVAHADIVADMEARRRHRTQAAE